MIEPLTDGTERLLHLSMNCTTGSVYLIATYAPTLNSSPDAKVKFYDDFDKVIAQLPQTEDFLVLGDLIARVGKD